MHRWNTNTACLPRHIKAQMALRLVPNVSVFFFNKIREMVCFDGASAKEMADVFGKNWV